MLNPVIKFMYANKLAKTTRNDDLMLLRQCKSQNLTPSAKYQ